MEERVLAPYASDFGRLLRHYRLAAGLSQEALAERARISANGIGALERGYRRAPQRETLALLVGELALNEEQREGFVAAAARSMAPRGASVAVGPWADTGIANLPLALTSFVGRDAELDEIARLMRDHRMARSLGLVASGRLRPRCTPRPGWAKSGTVASGSLDSRRLVIPRRWSQRSRERWACKKFRIAPCSRL